MTDAAGITFSTIRQRFAWNLRIARCRAGLRQRDLAELMGSHQAQIAVWESGKCLPQTASLARLAEALKIDVEELLRETQDSPASLSVWLTSVVSRRPTRVWRSRSRPKASSTPLCGRSLPQ